MFRDHVVLGLKLGFLPAKPVLWPCLVLVLSDLNSLGRKVGSEGEPHVIGEDAQQDMQHLVPW